MFLQNISVQSVLFYIKIFTHHVLLLQETIDTAITIVLSVGFHFSKEKKTGEYPRQILTFDYIYSK
jgi:hypothetical protein